MIAHLGDLNPNKLSKHGSNLPSRNSMPSKKTTRLGH